MNTNRKINKLIELASTLARMDDVQAMYDQVTDNAILLSNGDAAILHLYNFETSKLEVRSIRGLNLQMSETLLNTLGTRLMENVIQCGESLASVSLPGDTQWNQAAVCPAKRETLIESHRSTLSVPVMEKKLCLGVLSVFRIEETPFDELDQKTLESLSTILADALARIRMLGELEKKTLTDPLTETFNKEGFKRALKLEIERSRRHEQAFALMFIDLDNFKSLNDTYGHLMGDKLIYDVAKLLKKNCRSIDTVARFGGDEFVIIAPKTTALMAQILSQKLITLIDKHRFKSLNAKRRIQVNCSIGVAIHAPGQRESAEDLIERADMAMLSAKGCGKNQVVVADPLTHIIPVNRYAH